MSIRVVDSEIRLLKQKTRMPFRYGIATMTDFPLLFVRLGVTVSGQRVEGTSSDLLPPKWFTKVAEKAPSDEIEEMLEVIRCAASRSLDVRANSIFDWWYEFYLAQESAGAAKGYPPLLTHFGTSLVERAVIDAFCRHLNRPFAELVHRNQFEIELGRVHSELSGLVPGDLLPAQPLPQVIARHTVGLGDPLTPQSIPEDERVDDGLPQALSECIECYGLRHFKIKISGDLETDRPRLAETFSVIESMAVSEVKYTLDGNEQFRDGESFQAYWSAMRGEAWFPQFRRRLLFVEQPLHRDVALGGSIETLVSVPDQRPAFIIDESDAQIGSLPRALELGYQGTSHKNCKGVFKGLANRCLIEKRRRDQPETQFVMSGEDLCNQGPVALLQDLAVMACLGIESVERNGHHYCRGLSGLSASVQSLVMNSHSDLYHRMPDGWVTLRVSDGLCELGTVNESPFGVALDLPLDGFESVD